MNENIRATAERVVTRILDEYDTVDDFEGRAGGANDPHRTKTVKMAFKKGEFSGKRPGEMDAKHDEEEDEDTSGETIPHGARFKLKFGEGKERGVVAKSPGKVMKKKGTGHASKSGMKGVGYRKEDVEQFRECSCKGDGHAPWCKEKDSEKEDEGGEHESMGESRAKKLLNTVTGKKPISKSPGAIKYGKK